MQPSERNRRLVAYFYCNGCDLNLGVSIHFAEPNVEIHLPCGFLRIGWVSFEPFEDIGSQLGNRFLYRTFGYRG